MLVGFLRYMEHIYQRRFRILLTIDDLDKCSDQRVLDTFNVRTSDSEVKIYLKLLGVCRLAIKERIVYCEYLWLVIVCLF